MTISIAKTRHLDNGSRRRFFILEGRSFFAPTFIELDTIGAELSRMTLEEAEKVADTTIPSGRRSLSCKI